MNHRIKQDLKDLQHAQLGRNPYFDFGHFAAAAERGLRWVAERMEALNGVSLPGDAVMLRLPSCFAAIILAFAAVFVQQRTWCHARLLLLGALLTPGQRTVSSTLRIIELRRERHFVNYHRVLNRAVWDSRQAARLLLGLLISRFVPSGPIVLGVDDTIERRVASGSAPRAFTVIRLACRSRSSSRPAGCAGSA